MPLTPRKLAALRTSDATDVGNRLAKAIELSGETQVGVSRATGLPNTYVSDVARGRFRGITVENARKFAEHFGCRIEDLFPAREGMEA